MLEVGRVVKPHGLKGEVIVELVTNRTERVRAGEVFESDLGELEIVRSTPHAHRWIVAFKGMSSREDADRLRGVSLRAAPLDDPDALWVHELIGSEVVDTEGVARGRVVAIEANPASDLLVLDNGALVPARFVTSQADRRVVIDAPIGLFD